MTRRFFSEMLVAGGGLLIAGIVGIPALLAGLSPALRSRRRDIWRTVGPLSEFPTGEVREAMLAGDRAWPRSLQRQVVFVWRPAEKDLIVFSRSCTDLGCPLDYDPGSACYFCPCHGGVFAQDGARLAGPPSGPMHRYTHRVRDGVLEVDVASLPPAAA